MNLQDSINRTSVPAMFLRFSTDGEQQLDPNLFHLGPQKHRRAVFTTFSTQRADGNGAHAFFLLDEHLARLQRDARDYGLPTKATSHHDADWMRITLHQRVAEFLSSFGKKVEQVRVRLVLTADWLDLYLDSYTNPWENLRGIHLKTHVAERPIPELKTTLMQVSVEARRKAIQLGYQEALLVDQQDMVREGAWTNIFWITDSNALCTTAQKILPGITRALLLDHFDVEVVDIRIEELVDRAQEMFVTQSTSGITPVVRIDNCSVGSGEPGATTKSIQREYKSILQQRLESLLPR